MESYVVDFKGRCVDDPDLFFFDDKTSSEQQLEQRNISQKLQFRLCAYE